MAEKGKEMSTIKHNDWLFEQLKDAEFAAEYLNAASEDDDPKTYLKALRKVVEARGGMASVAQKTDLSRETLYRTLSSRGNPTIRTLSAVLKATGLKFGVTAHWLNRGWFIAGALGINRYPTARVTVLDASSNVSCER